jgi:hypothetical protein
LIFFNGGGSCAGKDLAETIEACYQRSMTELGTTRTLKPEMSLDGNGVLSSKAG